MTLIRRRGLEEEQSAPSGNYEIVTVTQKCTTTSAVNSYLSSLGYKNAIFLWISDGQAITNNRIVQMGQRCLRYRNGTIAVANIATNYDATFNVGDKYLVLQPAYGATMEVPPNMGKSVTTKTASATCTNLEQVNNILTANVLTIAKTIGTTAYEFAMGLKGKWFLRVQASGLQSHIAASASYDYRLNQGDELYEIAYY